MKYHYKKPDITVAIYGSRYSFGGKHPAYSYGTLFEDGGKGIIVVQQHVATTEKGKMCYWGEVDPDIANRIYLSPNFKKFFEENATAKNYKIYQLRKLMWALRIKPLKRLDWENYFGTTGRSSDL